jgi:flagella basal body P-ring formation protein FlgA
MIRQTLAAFALLITATASGTAQVAALPELKQPSLKSEATIVGDIVRIGDLIENAGVAASVPVFRSPDLGDTGSVPADTVLETVRKYGLIGVNAGDVREITVTRASRKIPVNEIADVIAGTLAARFDLGSSKDIVIRFAREMRAINVEPSAKGEPRVAKIDYDLRSGRFDATVEIPAAGGKRSAIQLSGRANATVEVATAARTVDRGSVLKDADLIVERLPRAEVGRDVITNPAQIVGLAPRAGLQPGRPIRAAELMKPDMVQRNETVTLVYEVPGVVLTLRGKAAEGGAEGDVITVLNEQTKRTLQGVIVGPGRVAISSGSPRVASNTATGSISNANSR